MTRVGPGPRCDPVINLIGHVMHLQSEHGQSEHFGLSDDKMYEPLSRRAESYHDSHPALLRLLSLRSSHPQISPRNFHPAGFADVLDSILTLVGAPILPGPTRESN